MSATATGGPVLVYKSDARRGEVWKRVFAAEMPEVDFRFWSSSVETLDATYLVAWTPPDRLQAAFPRLEVLFSVGAGVDQLNLSAIPGHVQTVRMIEPGLSRSLTEYALFGVLALHRDVPLYLADQREGRWSPRPVVVSTDRVVGIMGLGVLGRAVAEAVRDLGFQVRGWSGSSKTIDGVATFSGEGERAAFLGGCDILVCLLPLSDRTHGILSAEIFAALPAGARLLNIGRGGHLVENDLLAALESGHVSSAVLDVLGKEPPPADHPLLRHPRVMITPHVAGTTFPETAARRVIEAIRRHRAGKPLDNVVERSRGY